MAKNKEELQKWLSKLAAEEVSPSDQPYTSPKNEGIPDPFNLDISEKDIIENLRKPPQFDLSLQPIEAKNIIDNLFSQEVENKQEDNKILTEEQRRKANELFFRTPELEFPLLEKNFNKEIGGGKEEGKKIENNDVKINIKNEMERLENNADIFSVTPERDLSDKNINIDSITENIENYNSFIVVSEKHEEKIMETAKVADQTVKQVKERDEEFNINTNNENSRQFELNFPNTENKPFINLEFLDLDVPIERTDVLGGGVGDSITKIEEKPDLDIEINRNVEDKNTDLSIESNNKAGSLNPTPNQPIGFDTSNPIPVIIVADYS